mmetsp:Transcript_16926/g.49884  ORF Transcript_16926/g.49884 Transcript_16926/m.49884 type:complete len:233 (-) Transcript_16926:565-1263(-)
MRARGQSDPCGHGCRFRGPGMAIGVRATSPTTLTATTQPTTRAAARRARRPVDVQPLETAARVRACRALRRRAVIALAATIRRGTSGGDTLSPRHATRFACASILECSTRSGFPRILRPASMFLDSATTVTHRAKCGRAALTLRLCSEQAARWKSQPPREHVLAPVGMGPPSIESVARKHEWPGPAARTDPNLCKHSGFAACFSGVGRGTYSDSASHTNRPSATTCSTVGRD